MDKTQQMIQDSLQLREGLGDGLWWLVAGLLALALLAALGLCVFYELRSNLVPNLITYPALLLGSLASLWLWADPWSHLLAALGCALVFGGLSALRLHGSPAMGMGIVKLYVLMGLALGPAVIYAALLAALLGIAHSLLAHKSYLSHSPHQTAATALMLGAGLII